MAGNRSRRRVGGIEGAARIALGVILVAGLVSVTAAPVSAEISTPQRTSWGLQTAGASDHIGEWAALGWAVEQVGGSMLVGGKFLEVTNGSTVVDQPWIAAFDAGTGEFLPWWRPDVDGAVLALASAPDGGVYVGGEMTIWNGVTSGTLVKIDPLTGDAWPGFSTRILGVGSVVRDIRLEPDGWLYVVGSFENAADTAGPMDVASAIRLDPNTGTIDRGWTPDVDGGSVWGVSTSRTRDEVYLAGLFNSVEQSPHSNGFVGLSSVDGSLVRGSATVPDNRCSGCTVRRFYDVVATEHGDIWLGGREHALFIFNESDLSLRLNHFTGCDLNQQSNCDRAGGEFQEIERVGDRIYAAGHFWGSHLTDTEVIYAHWTYPAGQPTGRISAVGAYDVVSGQRIQSFNPYMAGNSGGFAIKMATDGCLWLAGGITQVGQPGNQSSARDLARLCDETGPGPDPAPDPASPAPPTCAASIEGTEVTLGWVAPPHATDVIVERQIDGGSFYWRSRVPTTAASFTEAGRDGTVMTYRVKAKYETGWISAPTTCAPPLDLSTPASSSSIPPATCSASNDGRTATLNWTTSEGAVDYRVHRSIDGGPFYWRGRLSETTFGDTLRTSGLHRYQVAARGADGVWSDPTTCSPDLDPVTGLGGAAAPSSCTGVLTGDDAELSWPSVPDAIDYRIRRSVDGGSTYWRGRVTDPTFTDSLRSGAGHQYWVEARGADQVWSAPTVCTPELVGP